MEQFVEARLDSLAEIDDRIAALVKHVSSTVTHLREGHINELKTQRSVVLADESKKKFEDSVASFCGDLEYMSSRLRREIILMDKKTAFSQKEKSDVSLLPIAVDKKASWVGDWKFKEEILETQRLLGIVDGENESTGDGSENGDASMQLDKDNSIKLEDGETEKTNDGITSVAVDEEVKMKEEAKEVREENDDEVKEIKEEKDQAKMEEEKQEDGKKDDWIEVIDLDIEDNGMEPVDLDDEFDGMF